MVGPKWTTKVDESSHSGRAVAEGYG
jgi:hypothetical protein